MVMGDMLLHGDNSIRMRIEDIPLTTELLRKVVEKPSHQTRIIT